MDKSPQKGARRYVVEAAARVVAQLAQVADLARRGQDQTQALATLAVFEETLKLMHEDLARE